MTKNNNFDVVEKLRHLATLEEALSRKLNKLEYLKQK